MKKVILLLLFLSGAAEAQIYNKWRTQPWCDVSGVSTTGACATVTATGDVESVAITASSPLSGTATCTSGACSFTLGLTVPGSTTQVLYNNATALGATGNLLITTEGISGASDILTIGRSTNSQKLRIMQSDDGAGNANWLELYYDGVYWTQMVIRPNKSGTGTQRSLVLQGDPTTGSSAIELTPAGGVGKLMYGGSGMIEWSSTGTWFRPVTDAVYELGDSTHAWEKTWTAALAITVTASPLAADACATGTITWDASYIYVCTASGAWKRAALTGGY